MIIVQLTGGLGNQLFQYAMGRALSVRSNQPLKLDVTSYSWDHLRQFALGNLNIHIEYATKEEISEIKQFKPYLIDRIWRKLFQKEIPYYRFSHIKEQSFQFDSQFKFFRSDNVYVEGYWQSESYFKQIRSLLLKEIHLQDAFCSPEMINYKSQILECKTSISIHIRRGDYISNPHTTSYHGVCGIEYYTNAMEALEKTIENPVYFVFSDEKQYAKEVFSTKSNVVLVTNIQNDFEELFLMHYCTHHIIANSSFSWWGAWLNTNENKKVVAPLKWFAQEAMNLQTESLIPTSWVRI